MSVQPYINDLAQQMFIATADQDYILARLTYFNQLDTNFYWLSLHALEKYYKAILILNECSAK